MTSIKPGQRRPTVLVADDNQDITRLVEKRLRFRGYDVRTVPDGNQALAAIRADHPDIVVLDWVMPGMQGPAVCQTLKDDPETASIPVVLLTARAHEDDVAGGFARGADEYLTKPFDVDELDQVLRRLLAVT